MTQLKQQDVKRIIEKCQEVFAVMDKRMSRPLVDYRWRFLKKGKYHEGRREDGRFIKIPNSRKLNMIVKADGKEAEISRNREKSEEITPETDGQPIPRERTFHRYDLFEAVRSRVHIREGHRHELAALKDFLAIIVQIHDSIYENRRVLTDAQLDDFGCQVETMIGDSLQWESAYKILGRYKLQDVPQWLEEAKSNRSRLSIALTKMVSLMERVAKWRPRQMNGIDRFNYKRECVLRYLRDQLLKQRLYMISNGIQGNDGTNVIKRYNADFELARGCDDALVTLNAKGRKDWDGLRAQIVAVGKEVRDAQVRGQLRTAYVRSSDPSAGRVKEIREALEQTRWALESDHPAYFAMQLTKTGDPYMDEVIRLMLQGSKAMQQEKIMDSFSSFREAQRKIIS